MTWLNTLVNSLKDLHLHLVAGYKVMGSRCVKPPIIFGDVSRPQSMTVQWSKFAQQQTKKIV